MSNLKVNSIEPYSSPNVTISGSLTISGSGDPIVLGSGSNPVNITSSYALTASYALNGGGGGGSDFPYTGSAIISGSLEVTGSLAITGSTLSPLTLFNIQEFPDQATAESAGLTTGMVYRNGDFLMIVTSSI
jgi:hypothetical protein